MSKYLEVNCPPWDVFDDLIRWSAGEQMDSRLVWIVYICIPPYYWSIANIKKIWSIWSPVVRLDDYTKEMKSVSYAKMLFVRV